jgi:hyperosmotically inducible protein
MYTRKVLGAGVAACLLMAGVATAADDRRADQRPLDRSANQAAQNPNDTALMTKIKSALTTDDQVKARQINVEVNDGNVQLLGFVDTPEQKTAAARIVNNVEGVRSIANNIEVRTQDRSAGQTMSDGMITTKVKAALIADSRTKAHQIEVNTMQGVVQLGGFVDTPTAKTAATEVARSVDGVRSIKNTLEVKQ